VLEILDLLRWGHLRIKKALFFPLCAFFGQIAGLCSLKKPSSGKKIALFSHFADPSQQGYLKKVEVLSLGFRSLNKVSRPDQYKTQ
jgi:hypothetical protein